MIIFKKKPDDDSKKTNKVYGTVQIAGAGYVGKIGLDSGVPRLLGVRLERHSTGKKAAKKILAEGGYLNARGKGVKTKAQSLFDLPEYEQQVGAEQARKMRNQSRGYNFITGYHPSNPRRLKNQPFGNAIYRKYQGLNYRMQGEIDFENVKNVDDLGREGSKHIGGAFIGTKGKTLYAPTSDREVFKNFLPDVDDPIALRTRNKVKVFGNRLQATAYQLKKNGLRKSLTDNKGRVLVGAGVTLGAGVAAKKLAQKGLANIGVGSYFRKDGKLVKSHNRKLKRNRKRKNRRKRR